MTAVSARLPAIDALRGIALFGILVVNLASFHSGISGAIGGGVADSATNGPADPGMEAHPDLLVPVRMGRPHPGRARGLSRPLPAASARAVPDRRRPRRLSLLRRHPGDLRNPGPVHAAPSHPRLARP